MSAPMASPGSASYIFANAAGQLVYSAGVDPRVLAYESDLSDNRASDADQLTPQPDLEVVKTRPDGAILAGASGCISPMA